MKYVLTTMMFLVAVLLTAAPAAAEDLQPPWWRGQISTTSQVWEFSDHPGPPPPEGQPWKFPPDGPADGGQPPLPGTEVQVQPGPEPWNRWMDSDEPYPYDPNDPDKVVGHGVWPLSGWMKVWVDNHDPNPDNEKWLWVQVTWRPQDPADPDVPHLADLDPEPINDPEVVEEIELGPLWKETTYHWKSDRNPPHEVFTISGLINVDELVVDTWCVIPEPGTLAMLLGGCVVGLLACLRRRTTRRA